MSAGGFVGVVGGQLAPVVLHPDECLYQPASFTPLRCLRRSHPTRTSDCARDEGWRVLEFRSPPAIPDPHDHDELEDE